jgi:hypothetical protein
MQDDLRSKIRSLFPPTRAHLLAGALAFTRAASQVSGVLRVALIGSLATSKPEPKDVDLLVTVADDADLTLLAAHGRKLLGHCQSRNLVGKGYLVLGTLDRYVWKQGVAEPLAIQEMVEQLHDFIEVLELRRA